MKGLAVAFFSPPSMPFKAARVALAAAGLVACSAPAMAWDVYSGVSNFADSFAVSSWSGNHAWVTQQEGWGASHGLNGSIPNDFMFQTWSGSTWQASTWSGTDTLPAFAAEAFASWYHTAITDERADYGEANVWGTPRNGASLGAYALYDFQLVLDPGAMVELTYTPYDDSQINISRSAGDEGFAFAGLKLYAPTADLNAAGGANDPYFGRNAFMAGGADESSLITSLPVMSYTFRNETAESLTYDLRFEAHALLFTAAAVPEPQTWALCLGGLALLGAVARRRQR